VLIEKAKKALELSKNGMHFNNFSEHKKEDMEATIVTSKLIGNPMFQLLFQPKKLPRTKAKVFLLAQDILPCITKYWVVWWIGSMINFLLLDLLYITVKQLISILSTSVMAKSYVLTPIITHMVHGTIGND